MYDAKEVTLEMTGVPEVSAMIAQIQDEVKGIAEVSNCVWPLNSLNFKLAKGARLLVLVGLTIAL